MPFMKGARSAPVLLCLTAAAFWGVWWLPIRALEQAGMPGGFAGLAMSIGALPALLCSAYFRGGSLLGRGVLGAAAIGVAVTLYGTALTLTDVVRAVLLFYLAPAWSTIIECAFLGRRWSLRSALAILCSLTGMVVILGGDLSLAGWGVGDLMALISGIAWSIGAALLFTDRRCNSASAALATGVAAVLSAAALAPLTADLPEADAVWAALPWALLSGTIYLAPILGVTLWAALVLSPATMSFLLTVEIVTGVVSSAIFLDQRFGFVEGVGTVLVVSGAILEVVLPASSLPDRSRSVATPMEPGEIRR